MRETFKTKDLIRFLPEAIHSQLMALEEINIKVIVESQGKTRLLNEILVEGIKNKDQAKENERAVEQILDIVDYAIDLYEKCLKEGLIKGEEE